MILNLEKGMTLDLTKVDNADKLTEVSVGVNWGMISKGGFFGFGADKQNVDLDLSAIMYDSDGKHVETVYYGNLSAKGVRHSGDDLTGDAEADDKDNEVITVKLPDTQPRVTKIVFVLVSFRGQDFGDLPYAGINLYNTTSGKVKLANTNVDIAKDSKYKGKVSMVFAALERKANWGYRIIAEPTDKRTLSDLVPVCSKI